MQSREKGKYQESIQPGTIPDLEYHMSDKTQEKRTIRESKGRPFPSR